MIPVPSRCLAYFLPLCVLLFDLCTLLILFNEYMPLANADSPVSREHAVPYLRSSYTMQVPSEQRRPSPAGVPRSAVPLFRCFSFPDGNATLSRRSKHWDWDVPRQPLMLGHRRCNAAPLAVLRSGPRPERYPCSCVNLELRVIEYRVTFSVYRRRKTASVYGIRYAVYACGMRISIKLILFLMLDSTQSLV